MGAECGHGGPALSLWLACPVGACVPRGWWEAAPVGLALHRWEGRLVSGAVPPLTTRPLGRVARVLRAAFPGCGWCGRGTRHRPHNVRCCEPLLRAVGVAGGLPREGLPYALVRGV